MSRNAMLVKLTVLIVVLAALAMVLGNEPWGPY